MAQVPMRNGPWAVLLFCNLISCFFRQASLRYALMLCNTSGFCQKVLTECWIWQTGEMMAEKLGSRGISELKKNIPTKMSSIKSFSNWKSMNFKCTVDVMKIMEQKISLE